MGTSDQFLGGRLRDVEKDRLFTEWALTLDKKFLDWSYRPLGTFDEYVMHNNTKSYDRTFKTLTETCRVPDCKFPLRKDGGQERLPIIGDVCNLCYFMYHLLNAKAYWTAIQAMSKDKSNNRYDH